MSAALAISESDRYSTAIFLNMGTKSFHWMAKWSFQCSFAQQADEIVLGEMGDLSGTVDFILGICKMINHAKQGTG
jgi:hypothetical protein